MARYGWILIGTRELQSTENDLLPLVREEAAAVSTGGEVEAYSMNEGGPTRYMWSRMQNRDSDVTRRLFVRLCREGWRPRSVVGIESIGPVVQMIRRFDD